MIIKKEITKMKKLLLIVVLSVFVLIPTFTFSEVFVEPYVGYNSFQKINALNNLIENYTFFANPPATFSIIKGGWDFGAKLGIEITKQKNLFLTGKMSYLDAETDMRYLQQVNVPVNQGTLNWFLGYPDNFKVSLLTGQVGLRITPYQTKKASVGFDVSGGPASGEVTVDGTGLFFNGTSSFTYTFDSPYKKTSSVFEVSVIFELKPFTASYDKPDDLTSGELFPVKETTLTLAIGSRFANIGDLKSTKNIDLNSDGVIDIPKGTTLKNTLINLGDPLKLDLSSLFFNVGVNVKF
ncbi:MAG: hypothetical protein A2539_04395 [Elusimicrobia bacterium RIFOXYD2_FULL_34_15]|nr:MAG: hypothetical protein A2539_04395 [Elusimicrobia bacterium RIFOXYD2_FULL_34_15]